MQCNGHLRTKLPRRRKVRDNEPRGLLDAATQLIEASAAGRRAVRRSLTAYGPWLTSWTTR
jgi:hypothetical protein